MVQVSVLALALALAFCVDRIPTSETVLVSAVSLLGRKPPLSFLQALVFLQERILQMSFCGVVGRVLF